MPDIKNQFTGGKMNKDVDERLVPKGEYIDAMNIQVSTSEGSDVGTIQNVLGNIEGCSYDTFLTSTSSFVVGTVSDEKNDSLYWLVSGQPYVFGNAIANIGDWSSFTTMTDSIIRKRPGNYVGAPDRCEPVFVDQFAFTSENNTYAFTNTLSALPADILNQIESGWTVAGITNTGSISNTVSVGSVQLSTPVQANLHPFSVGSGFVVPLIASPSGATSMPANNNILYIKNPHLSAVPSGYVGETVELFDPTHFDHQLNDIVSASFVNVNWASGAGETLLRLVMLNDVVPFSAPQNINPTYKASGDALGTSYQNSIIWGAFISNANPGLIVPIPHNVVLVNINDLDVSSLTPGDPIAFGNTSGCVGTTDSTYNTFTAVDCTTSYPIIVSSAPFAITLPLNTIIHLDDTLQLNASHNLLLLSKPRVLNFNHDEYITGINIVDDMLFWTDGKTEPKKINISRSVQGTNMFGLDHTRLINSAQGINYASSILAQEEHITVVRKAPLKAPFIEMETSARKGIVGVNGDVIAGGDGYIFDQKVVGEEVEITINDVGGGPPDYEIGDILLLAADVDDLPDNYNLRVSIISITDSVGSTTYVVQIQSFTSSALINTVIEWYVLLEPIPSLFERKLPRFAYRYKYEDNEYSSFSPFSEVAFIPSEFSYEPIKAYNEGMINSIKSLVIKDFVPSSIPLDVVQVDILYKNEISPTVYLLKSITPTDNVLDFQTANNWNSPGSVDYIGADKGAYKVSSENISRALPSSQSLRVWDNVPKKAKAQEVTGNRIVYGNYETGYNAIQPQIITSLSSRPVDLTEYSGEKSIKSLRDYDIGVVWGDKYGRETPVKTSGNSVPVRKSQAGKSNYLKVELENSPNWADYYRFYIKETSNEYYNLAMDRLYDAEDGNVWVSFPSIDRNKVDEDDYIVLKKGADASTLVEEKARYKIVAIENEAPEYIKTSYEKLLRTNTDSSKPASSCNLWGGTNGVICTNLVGGKNAPKPGRKGFSLNAARWSRNDYSDFHTAANPLGMQLISPKILLDEVSGNTSGSTTDELYVSFTQEITTGAGTNITESRKYHVINVEDDAAKTYIYVTLDTIIHDDDDWITSYQDGTGFEMHGDNIHVHFWKKTITNKPEFDGRFFVKILNDNAAQKHLIGVGLETEKYLRTRTTAPLYKVADPALTLTGSEYDFNATVSTTTAPPNAKTDSRIQWEAILEFGTGVKTSRWFVDNATFASQQGGTPPASGLLDHQLTAVSFSDAGLSITNRPSCNLLASVLQSYTTSGCTMGQNPGALSHSLNLGSGRNTGQLGMKGVHQQGTANYIDISYSKLGPDGHAIALNGEMGNGTVDWRVGKSGNPSSSDEVLVVAGLKEGERFKMTGSGVVYKILQVNKYRLFNYHGRNTAEASGFHKPPTWAIPINSTAETIDLNCPFFWNAQHIYQVQVMQFATNRRSTYRIKYEVDLQFSPGSTPPNTRIDSTGEPYNLINNGATTSSPTSGTIEFLTEYRAEGDNTISDNPAIFETEPKEDVDIDIYYEASSSIPTFPLTNRNKHVFIPVGSTLVDPIGALPYGFPTGIFVTSWGEVNGATPVYKIYLSVPLTPPQFSTFASQPLSYIEKDNGEIVTFKIMSDVMDAANINIVGFEIEPRQEVGLNWFNCWSFKNGVESNRIGDTYNKPYVTNGVTASSSTEETEETDTREYGLIYSGIYNSTSSVNNLNQFIAAEKITKDVNPIYGSIQKLYSGWGQGGDLVALCEDRILKILANKDALYNADGNTNVTSTNNVLGTTTPYSGEFGISKNPESFASEAYRVYFTDKVRGTVMRLSRDGLTPISAHGMKDWFRDNLKLATKLVGSYDDKKDEYNITLMKPDKETVTFREDVKGWVSFKSFTPENAISCANEYYTFLNGKIWKHHVEQFDALGKEINRNTFYNIFNSDNWSTFNTIFNDSPGSVKSFNTINYEGSNSRIIKDLSQLSHENGIYSDQFYNLASRPGWFVDELITNKESGSIDEFIEKEGKWFNYIKGENIQHVGSNLMINPDGSSTFDQSSFAIQGIGRLASDPADTQIFGCTDATMFNYDAAADTDDGSCVAFKYGCVELDAFNYGSTANTDNGSCIWYGCTCDGISYSNGCTNATPFSAYAVNYISLPTAGIIDDGSCIGIVSGCTNPIAFNYNPLANTNDGSCIAVVNGCMLSSAINNSASVNTDDGTCTWYGCTDATANNYGLNNSGSWPAEATGYAPNSGYGIIPTICTYDDGCTDPMASNYDATAITDDGSCDYCTWGVDPNTGGAQDVYTASVIHETFTGNNDGDITFTFPNPYWTGIGSIVLEDASGILMNTMTFTNSTDFQTAVISFSNLAPGDYYIGITQHASSLIGNQTVACVYSGLTQVDPPITILPGPAVPILGCTDPTALNYDATANTDDGSCVAVVLGCTDATASNYDALANTDDGNCIILAIGDTYGGGIVFHLFTGGGGLIAAATDSSSGCAWGCHGTAITGADGLAIGTGAQNTIDILNDCTTAGIAADVANNASINGYNDWYLPSASEIIEMVQNIGSLDLLGLGDLLGLDSAAGIANSGYWSSTEGTFNSARTWQEDSQTLTVAGKNFATLNVRVIRTF